LVARSELEKIDPPKEAQETLSEVVKAENERLAAIDFLTATETIADGQKCRDFRDRGRGSGDQARRLEWRACGRFPPG
jgi:regulator of protease activity HflC (stomatin/prohibitin superfamily)